MFILGSGIFCIFLILPTKLKGWRCGSKQKKNNENE